MKKVIKLTESDLLRIVKRVISENRETLTEQVVVDNVKISPTNSTYGGPVSLEYKGVKTNYSVTAKVSKFGVTLYNGKVGIVSIWKKGNEVCVTDNTDKLFKIEQEQLNKMIMAAKSKQNSITFAGVGEVKGVEGDYVAKLIKVA